MIMSSNSHTSGVNNGVGTSALPEQTILSRVAGSFFFEFFLCVVFCWPLFVLLYFVGHCTYVFDLRLLITPWYPKFKLFHIPQLIYTVQSTKSTRTYSFFSKTQTNKYQNHMKMLVLNLYMCQGVLVNRSLNLHSYCARWFEVRGGCLFCSFVWNCLQSLLKLWLRNWLLYLYTLSYNEDNI